MLNTLNLGESILSVRATDEVRSQEPLSFISSFGVPSLTKIPFRGILLCLFYKTTGGFLKVIMLEARRGPNSLSAYETFDDRRLEFHVGDSVNKNPLFVEFATVSGYENPDDLLRVVWAAALCNIPLDDLSEFLSQIQLS